MLVLAAQLPSPALPNTSGATSHALSHSHIPPAHPLSLPAPHPTTTTSYKLPTPPHDCPQTHPAKYSATSPLQKPGFPPPGLLPLGSLPHRGQPDKPPAPESPAAQFP